MGLKGPNGNITITMAKWSIVVICDQSPMVLKIHGHNIINSQSPLITYGPKFSRFQIPMVPNPHGPKFI